MSIDSNLLLKIIVERDVQLEKALFLISLTLSDKDKYFKLTASLNAKSDIEEQLVPVIILTTLLLLYKFVAH